MDELSLVRVSREHAHNVRIKYTRCPFTLKHIPSLPITSTVSYGDTLLNGRRIIIGKKTSIDTSTSSTSERNVSLSDATPHVDVANENVEKEKLRHVVNTNDLGSYPPLPTQETTSAGNAPGKSSYANVTGKRVAYPAVANYVRDTWGKYGLVRSMFSSPTWLFYFQFISIEGLSAMLENDPWFIRNNPLILKKWHPDVNLLKEDVGIISVWVKLHGVPVMAFSEDGLSPIATKLGTPLMLDSYTADICMQSWGRLSYVRAMIELRADVELKDNIVVAMLKIIWEGHYTCSIRVEYEWKPSRCASCKVFGHIHEECPKKIGAGETKNLKKTTQAPKGILVGPKVGFKPTKEYRHVTKKPIANPSSNKKQGVDPTNKGTPNLNSNRANSSGSSLWNVNNSSTTTTPIMDKIGKFENLIIDGQAILVDETHNPLKKVKYPGDHVSDDEVASVDNDMARSMASEGAGFGTQSLLEQWRDSYGNSDSDEDPYDDMYDGQDLTEEIQTICDELDIRFRGRKK
ncbi:retrotransposon protein, putative, ty1-copia subclass [Tanacetum coccineum]|uniref:Retrotransposon protein, putative, ty1-copia subclass n=1 Tax=Tanacetum coccineum TaxID=301880 RepID=A0ABQ5EBU8_9ASTR